MIRTSIYFILIFGFLSCRYIGPADGIFTKNVEIKPETKALEGVWEVDQQSYDLVREQYSLNGKKIKLLVFPNGTFNIENLPDFINDGFGKSINNRFHNVSGNWNLEQVENHWKLAMNYNASELYPQGCWTLYDLFMQKNDLMIWVWIGDPDSGNRLLFKKEK